MTKKQYKKLVRQLREIRQHLPEEIDPNGIYADINIRINGLASVLSSLVEQYAPQPEPERETPPWALQALPKGHPERS